MFFSCENSEIFKNSIFTENLLETASALRNKLEMINHLTFYCGLDKKAYSEPCQTSLWK